MALIALLFIAQTLGFRLNETPSMPIGIYRVRPANVREIHRNTIVAICAPRRALAVALPRHYLGRGICEGDVEPLVKEVAAVSGDRVEVTNAWIAVNGRRLPRSGRLMRDSAGRPLAAIAAGKYLIKPGTFWLYGPNARSWDSRYFGPVSVSNLVGVATPILVQGQNP